MDGAGRVEAPASGKKAKIRRSALAAAESPRGVSVAVVIPKPAGVLSIRECLPDRRSDLHGLASNRTVHSQESVSRASIPRPHHLGSEGALSGQSRDANRASNHDRRVRCLRRQSRLSFSLTMAKRMGATTVEVDSSHVPMISHPDAVRRTTGDRDGLAIAQNVGLPTKVVAAETPSGSPATAPCPARCPCLCLRSSASLPRRRRRWRRDGRRGRRGSPASRSCSPCRPNIAGRRSAIRVPIARP